jgi:hypothetical protein
MVAQSVFSSFLFARPECFEKLIFLVSQFTYNYYTTTMKEVAEATRTKPLLANLAVELFLASMLSLIAVYEKDIVLVYVTLLLATFPAAGPDLNGGFQAAYRKCVRLRRPNCLPYVYTTMLPHAIHSV